MLTSRASKVGEVLEYFLADGIHELTVNVADQGTRRLVHLFRSSLTQFH